MGDHDPVPAELERVVRDEARFALATVARLTGDLQLAEDAVQEALVAALRTWPQAGVPANPGAWLTTAARNRALDVLRRESSRHQREADAVRALRSAGDVVVHPIVDDQLRLVFTCCHPALARTARVPLTLRLVCGLSTRDIARVLLETEEAVAKRIQRAKGKIRAARIPLVVPAPEQLPERLPSVLEVLYLVFTEGYAATAGPSLLRDELCDESIRLAGSLVDLVPSASVSALLALMVLQDSRRAARTDERGDVVLADQDRALWDRTRIAEGMAHLERARAAPELDRASASHLLQACIAAEHARAPSWDATDWPAIVGHYDVLLALTGSPVVGLNRAVALSFAGHPAEARRALAVLADDPRVARSPQLWIASADVCRRLGAAHDASQHYRRALTLITNERQRDHVAAMLAEVAGSATG